MSPAPPITLGAKVIRIDGADFRALTVTRATSRYLVASHPEGGGECGAPAVCFLAVPEDWPAPPPPYLCETRAVEAAYSGPIPAGMLQAAATLDAALPALARKLDAAEAWLAWVVNHLHPLSPALFEPHLREAQAAKEAAMRRWLRAASLPAQILAAE
jgi:hypothetical protein